eukprot:CAMPEP_0202956092 /NCGR_PEP_ID=MMETSP1396-20130829/649_1 /ASSEMBLY_ACC=CAM_ASM_000872 /TAXON_ID= /ORGANISM="Pseudokeronopsis sp., Strain Brazil" /LENGTH=82 /DNA_ID=CAMNT_0049672969 /DNA_START=182 /DNA_END=430 /DNA_ORIENTATION=-
MTRLSPLVQNIRESDRYIKHMAVGENHFVAVLGSGEVMGAGSNEYSQLGLPNEEKGGTNFIQKLQFLDMTSLNLKENNISEV